MFTELITFIVAGCTTVMTSVAQAVDAHKVSGLKVSGMSDSGESSVSRGCTDEQQVSWQAYV